MHTKFEAPAISPIVGVAPSGARHSQISPTETSLRAEKLLLDYKSGQDTAKDLFKNLHPAGKNPSFVPQIFDARQVVMYQNMRGQKLGLETLKKRAKTLLKQIKSGDALALHRAQSNHPKLRGGQKPAIELSLVDCHHILAREHGFDSWPKLKHHLQALQQVARFLQSGGQIDSPDTLHIRCGTDIRDLLTTAGFKGDFRDIIDPFVMGPVLPDGEGEIAIKFRSRFIEAELGAYRPAEESRDHFEIATAEQQFLHSLPASYDEITLWFEHDAYDQLCLARILHIMAKKPVPLPFDLRLVQVDHFPGVKKFIGLGNLGPEPEGPALLYQQRIEITPAMIAFGARIWTAFTDKEPVHLWKLAQEKHAPLPLMQQAVLRLLAELPHPQTGLGLTETLSLKILHQEGPLLARRVFLLLLSEQDPQPFLGDIMFYSILKKLWHAPKPALDVVGKIDALGQATEILRLNSYGEALLNKEANWLEDNPVNRWIGGVQISSDFKQNWYLEHADKAPVLQSHPLR